MLTQIIHGSKTLLVPCIRRRIFWKFILFGYFLEISFTTDKYRCGLWGKDWKGEAKRANERPPPFALPVRRHPQGCIITLPDKTRRGAEGRSDEHLLYALSTDPSQKTQVAGFCLSVYLSKSLAASSWIADCLHFTSTEVSFLL